MTTTLYSAKGCIRCRIVKEYLDETGVEYTEEDIRTEEGDAAFKVFYRTNRKSVRRDKEGIFFPVLDNGETIRQDAGSTLSFLMAGDKMDEAITPNNLGHGWTGGLNLAADGIDGEIFVDIVSRLQKGGLKVCVNTNGNNPEVLEALTSKGLIDRLEFDLMGPAAILEKVEGAPAPADVAKSFSLLSKMPELKLTCFVKERTIDGETRVLTAEEAGQTAQWLAEASGEKTLPLCFGYAEGETPEGMEAKDLFKYRMAARRWQVKADLLK